jgi:GNAT superfamily N-acetyltransferase
VTGIRPFRMVNWRKMELDPTRQPPWTMIIDFLSEMSGSYPGIRDWYRTRVMPGLKEGTRKLFWRYGNSDLIALGIAKKTPDEKKICTLRVAPGARGLGVGFHLTEEMLNWLEERNPHFTIAEGKLPELKQWIDHYGFRKTDEHFGLYVPHKTELLFNEH